MKLHYRFRRRSSDILLMIIAAAVLVYGAADSVTVAMFEVVVAVLAGAWAIKKLTTPYSFASTSLYVPFALIITLGFIQWLLGTSVTPATTQHSLSLWLAYAAFFVIAVNVQADPTIRSAWAARASGLALLVSVLAIVQTVLSRDYVLWRAVPGAHPFGPFVDVEYFSVLAILLFPLVLSTSLESRDGRLLGFSSAAVLAAAVGASGSTSGLTVIVIEFAVILVAEVVALVSKRGRQADRIVSSLGGFAVIAVLMVAAVVMAQMDPSRRETTAAADLAPLRTAAWELFQQRPVTGHGLGAFFAAHDAAYPPVMFTGTPGSEPLRFVAELGVAGIAAQLLLLGLLPILARTRRAWLAGVMPLAAAWSYSWAYGWLESPALVLVALGLGALVATDGVRRPRKGILRPKRSPVAATQTHQNQSPQREYQVSSSE